MGLRAILHRLDEATFAIREDVDVVYGRSGLYRVGMAQRDGKAALIEELSNWPEGRVQWDGSSGDLVSEAARAAHAVNPVRIMVGVHPSGSFYVPAKKFISISLQPYAVKMFKIHGFKDDMATIRAIDAMVAPKNDLFWGEFAQEAIRGTIAHELAHWIDDSLHGGHIGRKSARAQERGTGLDPKYKRATQSPLELNAQVHAVQDIRDKMGDAFDGITWRELLVRKSSLASNLAEVDSEEEYQDVMRRFVQRLNREGLLVAGLRRIPTWKKMQAYAHGASE